MQNRNKLIELFVGNLTNAIVHRVLEKAINDEDVARRYDKEQTTSFEIAKKYREKINPAAEPLPDKDKEYIKLKIVKRVRAELMARIEKGYQNIDLYLVETYIEEMLKELCIV